jgi:hypothetical protein
MFEPISDLLSAAHRSAGPRFSPPDPVWFDRLTQVWQDTGKDELERRRAVGVLVNEVAGLPYEPPPRGAKAFLRRVAKLLNVSPDELEVMRLLQVYVDTGATNRAEGRVTWADMKRKLTPPGCSAPGDGAANTPRRSKARPPGAGPSAKGHRPSGGPEPNAQTTPAPAAPGATADDLAAAAPEDVPPAGAG